MRILKALLAAAGLLLMPLSGYAFASAKPSADLAVSMTASPQPVVVNWNVTYRIVVRNNGPSAATNVKLLDEYGSDAYYSWADAIEQARRCPSAAQPEAARSTDRGTDPSALSAAASGGI
jgi:Domain of unknown function DUF11